jgi:hypothetical protein
MATGSTEARRETNGERAEQNYVPSLWKVMRCALWGHLSQMSSRAGEAAVTLTGAGLPRAGFAGEYAGGGAE